MKASSFKFEENALARSRRGRARFVATAVACSAGALLLASCGGADAPLPPATAAQAPLARLWLPIFASPNVSVMFDASDSQSPGGSLAHYFFDFGDGTAQLDSGSPLAAHTYASEGVYAVQLTAVDLSGATAVVQSQLTIRSDAPLCTNDASCDTGQRCQPPACAISPPCAQICLEEVGRPTP